MRQDLCSRAGRIFETTAPKQHKEVVLMSHPRYTSEEIVERGEELYNRHIRARVEAGNEGKFLVLDIETGAYEVDTDELAAVQRAKAKNPNAVLYIMRIGYTTAYKIGGQVVSS